MLIETARRVLRIEAEAITHLMPRIDTKFIAAVKLCQNCQGHVIVVGIGKSGLIGKKISATLASTGTPAYFLHPAEGMHGDLGILSKQDVILALSHSGETEEVVRLLPLIKRLGLPIIAMTGNIKSTLAERSDVVLDISVEEEACSLGLAPTASTTAALAMGDALAVALLQAKGFSQNDFASFHPGGALGYRLLTVADVMHTGEAIPIVEECLPLHEAILEMTEKKLGMVAVIDRERKLSGIVTDGDLRRFIQRIFGNRAEQSQAPQCFGEEAFAISRLMTQNPKTVSATTLAAEAVHKMETNAITVLVVVDDARYVVGVVHLHHLLQRKVV